MRRLLLLVRRLLDSSECNPVPSGVYGDPLSGALSPLGLDEVDHVFAHDAAAMRLTSVLGQFFGDERAEFALRKAAHIAFDVRLRAVVALARQGGGGEHLLDDLAMARLRQLEPSLSLGAARAGLVRNAWAGLTSRTVLMIGEALATLARRGRWSLPEPLPHLAVMGVALARQFLAPLRQAMAAAGLDKNGDVLVVADGTPGWQPPKDCPPLLDLKRLPVPIGRWLSQVVGPMIRLASRTLAVAARAPRDPWTLQLCIETLRLARDSQAYIRLTYSHRPHAYLDAEEATATHIIRGMVLGRHGGGVVRWPHSMVDDSGPLSSYLAYDLHLDSGPYQYAEYGRTWWPGTRRVSVGMVRHSREMAADKEVEPRWREPIEAHRRGGGRIAAGFLPSRIAGFEHLLSEPVATLARLFLDRKDWLLVVKPKGYKSYLWCRDLFETDEAVAQLRAEGRFLLIGYDGEGAEPCGSGYLIDRMDLGYGLGSVQIESAVRGKPTFGYFPAWADTTLHRKLAEAGLRTRDRASFEAAVAAWLDHKDAAIDYQWFRDHLDPFGDDRCLTRCAAILCTGEVGYDTPFFSHHAP